MALRATNDNIGMSMHFSDADPVAVCLVLGCQMHFHGDSRNDAMLAWSAHVSKDHREDWGDEEDDKKIPVANPETQFSVSINSRPMMTGRATITNHGYLDAWVMNTSEPLLREIIRSCTIKNVTLSMDIEQARPWVKPSAEVLELLEKKEPE